MSNRHSGGRIHSQVVRMASLAIEFYCTCDLGTKYMLAGCDRSHEVSIPVEFRYRPCIEINIECDPTQSSGMPRFPNVNRRSILSNCRNSNTGKEQNHPARDCTNIPIH